MLRLSGKIHLYMDDLGVPPFQEIPIGHVAFRFLGDYCQNVR